MKRSGWKDAMTIRRGYELNYKLISLPVENHSGTLPAEHSFVEVHPDNVIVSAMKKAEDENSLVVRFYEWAGKQGDVRLKLPAGARSASETNMMEKPIGEIPLRNGTITVSTKPYEIRTVKVRFSEKTETTAARP